VKALKFFRYCVLAIAACLILLAIAAPIRAEMRAQNAQSTPIQELVQQSQQHYEAGQFNAAIALLQQVVQAYEREGDRLRQATTLSNLALVYQASGQLTLASQAIHTSLELLTRQANASVLAPTLEIQGKIQLDQGQPQTALETWQKTETLYQQTQDFSGMTRSHINQAAALQTLGFYRQALTRLIELSHTLQAQPDSLIKVVELRSLGDTLQLTGDLDQAQQVLQTSLEIAERLQLPAEISAALLSLGNVVAAQPDPQQAIAFYQQAATYPQTQLAAQLNLLPLLPPDLTAPLLTALPVQLAALPISQTTAYAHIRLAQYLIDHHQTRSAATYLVTAIAQARELQDQRTESYAVGTLAGLYEKTQQWTEARTLTRQALSLIQTFDVPEITYRWQWQLGRLLKQQGKISEAIAAYDSAVDQLQLLRKDLVGVNRNIQFTFRDSVEPVYRESVALLLNATPNQAALEKARQRIESLQLAELDDFFREACIDSQSVILDEIVDQDNPQTAIVYPILLSDRLQVIVKIPQQPLRMHTVNQSRTNIETKLQQLREYITEPDRTREVKSLSQDVYQWLVAPIAPQLKRVNSLVFVLDGAFRSVPMAALHDGQHYLVESYAIALSPGLQLLKPKAIDTQQLRVLAAGLITPPTNFATFPILPAIPSEFASITQAGINTTQLLDQDFTRKSLESQVNAANFNVLHMATHGQFSSRAEETFILAADGPINVSQFDTLLRHQDPSKTIELLVLSACQTAAGDNRATLGLAGAAVRAGARSTLASLWNVGDRSTAILMGEFYQELAQSNVTKAEALRRAQITLLKKYPNYSRPNYWAPYVLIGNWL
jgi:CHAT domain-containing protein